MDVQGLSKQQGLIFGFNLWHWVSFLDLDSVDSGIMSS